MWRCKGSKEVFPVTLSERWWWRWWCGVGIVEECEGLIEMSVEWKIKSGGSYVDRSREWDMRLNCVVGK